MAQLLSSIGQHVCRLVRIYRNEIVVLFSIAAACGLVFPVGEYLILDDWAYVKSLEHLHFEGRLKILEWNPMSLVGHLFWGLIFTKLFGFSFTVTKISVVVTHVIECIAVLRLLKMSGVPSSVALATVLCLIANPLHFVHSFMYMTDIPALTWQLVALACFVAGLRKERAQEWAWFMAGSLFTGWAYLTRQHGFLALAALLGYLVIWDRRRLRCTSFAAAVIPAAAIIATFNYWYRYVHGWTATFSTSLEQTRAFLASPPLEALPYIAMTFAVHLGLFVAPLVLPAAITACSNLSALKRGLLVFGAWILVYKVTACALLGTHFPFIRNVITRWGFFEPNEFVLGDRAIFWGTPVAVILGAAGAAAALLFCCILMRRPVATSTDDAAAMTRRLFLVFLSLQLAYLFATAPLLYDRHILILAPTALILVAVGLPIGWRPRWIFTGTLLAVYMQYSVRGTRDLHTISREAFAAGDELIRQGIGPERIDAGYAFDGWYMYERSAELPGNETIRIPPWWPESEPQSRLQIRQPWWVEHLIPAVTPEFVISLSPEVPKTMYGGSHEYALESEGQPFHLFVEDRDRRVYVLRARRLRAPAP